jgi:hypothetical protein
VHRAGAHQVSFTGKPHFYTRGRMMAELNERHWTRGPTMQKKIEVATQNPCNRTP